MNHSRRDSLPNERIIFALDVPDAKDAERYVKELEGAVGCFKVGLELFIKEGPGVLKAIRQHNGAGIFLDLKLHDIPATVSGALKSVTAHGARFVTVHCGEGEEALKKAADIQTRGLEVLAVTVLTSMCEEDLPRLGFRKGLTLDQLVLDRALMAQRAGCAGVICSGKEAALVRIQCGPDFKIVTPGIRPTWSIVSGDDQARITTPAHAIKAGADYIVVGRPIRDHEDPKVAAETIAEEIREALSHPSEQG